jgi:hypothetical protein
MCKTCVELLYVCGAHRIELVNVSIFLNTTHRLGAAHDERRDEGRHPRAAFVSDFISTKKCAFKALGNLQSVIDDMRQEWTQTRMFKCLEKGLGREPLKKKRIGNTFVQPRFANHKRLQK